MATNIHSQSPTELKSYLEECLHVHFPAASNQEVAHAVEVAMGRWGYMLDHSHDRHAHQGPNEYNAHHDQHVQNDQRGQQGREQLVHDNNQLAVVCASIAAIRDAAISAAQSLSESSLRMAAVACAWTSYAATCAQAEQMNQNQQWAARN
jgi:hypothetical protein